MRVPASVTSRDRIAEPWGARTPYGPGGTWPTRVDTYLAAGVSAEQVDRWVQSASILHSNGDGLDIAVSGGRVGSESVVGRSTGSTTVASAPRTCSAGRRMLRQTD